MAQPGARLVPIQCGSDSLSRDSRRVKSSTNLKIEHYMATGCTSSAPVPSSLHACSEARFEMAKYYRPHFGFARRQGHVFFDPTSDILYFGPRPGFMAADSQFHTCMAMCDPNELASIRRIAISDSLFWIDHQYRSTTAANLTIRVLRQIATHMHGLKEIFFIPRDQDATGPELLFVQQRMHMQVCAALEIVCEEYPEWKPPPCKMTTLQELSAVER